MTRNFEPLTPLRILNKQCAEHDGEWMERIRIHPQDYERLKKELIECGFTQFDYFRKTLSEVPIVMDEKLVEGPVIDWKPAPNLKEAVEFINRYMR